MKSSVASAPAKVILFGEHAVVYKKPAIAIAIDKRAKITVSESDKDYIFFKSVYPYVEARIKLDLSDYMVVYGEEGIVHYIMGALKYHDNSPINILLEMDIPLGAGIGSSAAVTVATISALFDYHDRVIDVDKIASLSHQVEVDVQDAASPLDTAISSFGNIVFLSEKSEIVQLDADLSSIPLVIGFTDTRGDTGVMVSNVRDLRDTYPQVMDSIMDLIADITLTAKNLLDNDLDDGDLLSLGQLMNINQELLDVIEINTLELSLMIIKARSMGAVGSKITGAGGGGSIIALCPDFVDEVFDVLNVTDNAIKVHFSSEGLVIH